MRRIVTQLHREMMGGPAPEQIVIPSNPLSMGLALVAGSVPAQTPYALALGCSDARVPIELIFDQSPNDLFVIRVAGNVLGVECLGSIDYAVANLGKSLKLVVVLGHTILWRGQCGGRLVSRAQELRRDRVHAFAAIAGRSDSNGRARGGPGSRSRRLEHRSRHARLSRRADRDGCVLERGHHGV